MKTVERAHTPKKLWEKIRLPGNYTKALEIVSEHLEYFPKYLVHRNKQRLTKIHQMIIRMRKMKLKGAGPKIVTTNTKVDRREKGRERKALKAAQLEKAIEEELLERLKQVNESEIYNYPEQQYNKALKMANDNYEEEEDAAVKERKKNKSATNGDDDDDDEEVESELEYEDEEEEEQEYNI
jgi:protein MAK16